MACSSALKLVIAKNIRNEVLLMDWSQKMDLIAVVNEANEILVNRLKWQCIWPQPLSKEGLTVRGIAWRPDEKVIAAAFDNGQILLFDVESREELHSYCVNEDIASIAWTRNTQEMPVLDDLEDDQSLIDLPPITLSSPKPTPIESAHTNSILNFLVIATRKGIVHLYAFGTLLSGTVNCLDFLSDEDKTQSSSVELLNARLSSSFDRLFVQLRINGNSLRTLILENSFLAQHTKSVMELSRRHCQLLDTMLYIDDVIQAIKEAWESVLLEMDTKLTKYADSVPAGSVSSDFIVLLVFGKASPELEHFLVHDLTDKGLKKLGNCIELSYTTIQKLVVHPLQTAILRICNHLSGLRGLSRNRYRYGDLLRESVVEEALQLGGSFLLKAFELQQTIDQSTRDYKNFFRWLYAVILALLEENVPDELGQMTQQELNYLAEFLAGLDDDEDDLRDVVQMKGSGNSERKFNLERVGQYLEDKTMVKEAYPATEWQKMLEKNACVAKNSAVYKHEAKASLVQQYKALETSVSGIFEQQQKMISESFKGKVVEGEISLGGDGDELKIRSHNVQTASGGMLNYFIYHLSEKEFVFYSADKDGEEGRFRKFQFQNMPFYYKGNLDRGQFAFLDIQFYNDETVSILLRCSVVEGVEQKEQERRVYFLQLPISSLLTERTNFYEVMDPNCLKLVDGNEWRYLAVSGNRKVCSILGDNRKRVCLYETELEEDDDEDEDEEMDNSNNFDVSK